MTHDQQSDDNWEWESPERRRAKRLEEETAEVGFPVVWVLIGGLAGLLTIGLIGLGVVQIINKRSAPTPTPPSLPTLALPSTETVASVEVETPTLAPVVSTPTLQAEPQDEAPLPTAEVVEPTPTPEPETVAPTDIQAGGYVQIVNTGGAGLNLRAGPGTNNDPLVIAEAEAILPVIAGPKEDEQGETDEAGNVHLWWYLRHTDGTEGWGRSDFLAPSLPPGE